MKADELFKQLKQAETAKKALVKQARLIKKNMVDELKKMPYTDYLQTLHWGAIRKRALKRARQKCQLCNSENAVLNVHHNNYERRGKERITDVIVLCQACHAKHHNKEQSG